MNYSDIARLVAGLFQLGVACYALRLGRFFGKTPVRWLLYSGVCLLALAYLLISIGPFHGGNADVQMSIIHSLFSLLLIAGMVQMEILLNEHIKAEKAEHEMRSNIDSRVTKQLSDLSKANEQWPKVHQELKETASRLEIELNEQRAVVAQLNQSNEELTRANQNFQETEAKYQAQIEELHRAIADVTLARDQGARATEEIRQAAAGFQNEINELNRSTTELIQTREHLTAANADLTNTNAELLQKIAQLETHIEEQKKAQEEAERVHQELIEASRQAGMSAVAASVFKKVTSVLEGANSVSELANQLTQSRIVPIVRISRLIWKDSEKPARCPSRNPRVHQSRQVPDTLARLARGLSTEQSTLLKKIDLIKKKIEDIKQSVATENTLEAISAEPTEEATPQERAIESETVTDIQDTATETPEAAAETTEMKAVSTAEEEQTTAEPAVDYSLQTGGTETATTETASAETPAEATSSVETSGELEVTNEPVAESIIQPAEPVTEIAEATPEITESAPDSIEPEPKPESLVAVSTPPPVLIPEAAPVPIVHQNLPESDDDSFF